MGRPLLLGHRGIRGSRFIQENTLPAFEMALHQGCDGFEFDVRLAADGVAVVCHGPRFKRGLVRKRTALQLRDLTKLNEVLERYAQRAFLDIELKEPGLGPAVLSALRAWPPSCGHVVSSFLPEVLVELRASDSSLFLGFICDRRTDLRRWRELPIDYLIPHHSLVSAELLDEAHAAGKKVLSWTVNNKAAMLRLAGWGIDGIISDRVELLAKIFQMDKEHDSRVS